MGGRGCADAHGEVADRKDGGCAGVCGAVVASGVQDALVAAPTACSATSFAPVVPVSGTAGASDAE